jgi:hypothetical protein
MAIQGPNRTRFKLSLDRLLRCRVVLPITAKTGQPNRFPEETFCQTA